MFSQIKRRIAFKLACIILFTVTAIGAAAMFVMTRDNKATLTEYLNVSLSDAVKFTSLAYSEPLWVYNDDEIARLNNIVLQNRFVVAVNIFNMEAFVSGAENQALETEQTRLLKTPYKISGDSQDIKKISGDILRNGETIGRFELFYTETLIDQAVVRFNNKMLISYLVTGAIIVCAVLLVVITTLTKPIIELARIVRELTQSKNFSKPIDKKTRKDEIGILFNGFVDMINQVQAKENEREGLQLEMEKRISRFKDVFHSLEEAVDNEEYSHRIRLDSEDDELVPSLNKMLETLENADILTKNQNWIKNGQAELSNIIGGEQSIVKLASKAINFIATYAGAHVGTIFIEDDKSKDFYLVASYAFKVRKGFTNRFVPGEGLPGQAVFEKKTILYTHVPEDYMNIESSLGHTFPHAIFVIPLIYEGDVKGVIELGSLEVFSSTKMDFLESVAETLAVAINAAMFNDQLSALFKQTKAQADELQKQQLELKASNQELEEQTKILRESEEKLQSQQEELQASNEELEEKTEMLEAQKAEIEKKNDILVQKQKEIEEKAEQLKIETKYKSEFLANMSHELRTPLNSLLILANMLAENEEQNLNEDQIESAASIYRSGQNLLHLINDILDLSKIEAKKIELSLSRIELSELGKNFRTEFLHMAKEKNLDFIVTAEENLPESIITDIHRLEQIIRNLIGNAMKFTEQGAITLNFSRPDPAFKFSRDDLVHETCVAVSVSDTGEGIPEDKIKLIFEAFKQVDGSISRRHGGTGLGLSISKELAALLGGELRATSVYGQGSTFTIYIPEQLEGELSPESSAPAPRRPVPVKKAPPVFKEPSQVPETPSGSDQVQDSSAKAPDSARKKKMVLIIEDDPEFSSVLESYFTKNEYTPLLAQDGETGIKMAVEQRPAAIILDIGLPGIDGWTVLSELKKNTETRHIPVHIMSGFDAHNQGIKNGAVGYLTKPVSQEGLNQALEKIESVLSGDVKNLLIVEDDGDLLLSVIKLMETHNIKTVAAKTGEEALSLLKSDRFECMILDIGLPDITGFELLDRIEADPDMEMMPVIVFTGRELTTEEAHELEKYSSSIVLKNDVSMERLLDETALFIHRVESDIPEAREPANGNEQAPEGSLEGKKVMVVDDDMRNAFALNKFLKSKGMEVSIANNGEKALALLDNEAPPDIVLMDIMMPVMDGYEAIKRIRAQERFNNMPVLALTAKAMASDRDECIKCGANDYLSKPLDTTKLLTMLRVWLY